MSALQSTPHEESPQVAGDTAEPSRSPASPVVVRRRTGLPALVVVMASVMAVAYLWRAVQGSGTTNWVVFGVLAGLAAYHVLALHDARTPLVVADEQHVKVRLGSQWRGLPWDAVDEVVVHPHRALRDGRLVVLPRVPAGVLDGLDRSARREALRNQARYGAALAVPVGVTTRVSNGHGKGVAAALRELAQDRAGVTAKVSPRTGRARPDVLEPVIPEQPGPEQPHNRQVSEPAPPAPEAAPEVGLHEGSPLRPTRHAARAQVVRDTPATVGQILPQPATEQHNDPGPTVRPISRIGPAVAPLVFDDLAAEPVRDPVIGPELAAARNRVGLSVDELADRTRIRPHVIESIEVDDFAPCGGDFYARGHLRTLARVLGTDPAPLLGAFEERYSSAPVNARRVFEAELATGMTGSMRGTRQGPRWGLLAAVVLCLLLVWGVVRFFAAESPSSVPVPSPALAGAPALEAAGDPVAEEPAPVDRDERGGGGPQPDSAVVEPLTVTVMAAHATTTVVVRDRDGRSVFEGELLLGQKRRVTAAPPVSVSAVDAGAVEIEVAGRDRGVLGELGVPGRRTFE